MTAGQATGIRSHRDLVVWQKAMDLVDEIYDLAEELPVEERFGPKVSTDPRGSIRPDEHRRREGASHQQGVRSLS